MSTSDNGQTWIIKIDVQDLLLAMSEHCVGDATTDCKAETGNCQEDRSQRRRHDAFGSIFDFTRRHQDAEKISYRVFERSRTAGESLSRRRGNKSKWCCQDVAGHFRHSEPEGRRPRGASSGNDALVRVHTRRMVKLGTWESHANSWLSRLESGWHTAWWWCLGDTGWRLQHDLSLEELENERPTEVTEPWIYNGVFGCSEGV